MDQLIDFDRFLAEREQQKRIVRIFGRDCPVPSELPWTYVLKVDAMLHGGPRVSGTDNLELLRRMFSPEDYAFIVGHPEFRASYVWELIARTWLRAGDDEGRPKAGPVFRTEDEVKIEQTRADAPKKERSARSRCSAASRLTSSGNTTSIF